MKTKHIKRKLRKMCVTIKHKWCKFSQRIDHKLNYIISTKFILNLSFLNLKKFQEITLN